MKILVAIILYVIFFIMCYLGTGSDKKNMGSFRSYPDEVQKKVREDEVLGKLIPEKSSLYFLILGEGLNLFDLL